MAAETNLRDSGVEEDLGEEIKTVSNVVDTCSYQQMDIDKDIPKRTIGNMHPQKIDPATHRPPTARFPTVGFCIERGVVAGRTVVVKVEATERAGGRRFVPETLTTSGAAQHF